MMTFNRLGLVSGGTALGALIRWSMTNSFDGLSDRWLTLGLNVVGSILLGGVLGWAAAKHEPDRTSEAANRQMEWTHLAVGTGFCGGLTSFSAFAVDVARLLQAGTYATASLAVFGTVLATTSGAAASYQLAKRRV